MSKLEKAFVQLLTSEVDRNIVGSSAALEIC